MVEDDKGKQKAPEQSSGKLILGFPGQQRCSNDMGVDLRVCCFIWHQNDWQPSHGSWFDHICTSFWRMGGSVQRQICMWRCFDPKAHDFTRLRMMTDDNVVHFVIRICFLFLLPFLDMGVCLKLTAGFLKASAKCNIKKKKKRFGMGRLNYIERQVKTSWLCQVIFIALYNTDCFKAALHR